MGIREWISRTFNTGLDRNSKAKEPPEESEDDIDPYNPFPDPIVIEFTDVLDLHQIPAKQAKAVVEDFLAHAQTKRYRFIRIIHGKGISVQREMVRSVLARNPAVIKFSDAPPEAGGWGATVAELLVKSLDTDAGE